MPEVLVDAEVNERCTTCSTGWRPRSWAWPTTSQATGTGPDDLLASVRSDAHRAVKADLGLRALAEAEELVVGDDDLEAEIVTMAERMGTTPAELRRSSTRPAGRRGTLGTTKG